MLDEEARRKLRRLSTQVEALRRAMEITTTLQTEDFGKWNGFANYARVYTKLAKRYVELTNEGDINFYALEKIPHWGDLVWHEAKNLFEQIYADVSILSASLSEFDNAGMMSRSEVHDLVSGNLRRAVFKAPDRELEIQNALETLFIGRGYQKGADYDRETGQVKYSGKEFIPGFVFPDYGLAIEVKLIRDSTKISRCVEEISADISAYLSEYESALFVVYDVGAIQDVAEVQLSFQKHAGVRVCVVKH